MSLEDFVKSTIGNNELVYLLNVRQGGDNNAKGTQYEDYFAVNTICSFVSSNIKQTPESIFYIDMDRLSQIKISSQELAFVDDFCVRDDFDNSKINYQAKNSSSGAADWTSNIEQRFNWQINIDINYFKVADSKQVLLVSCANKASENTVKIPSNMKNSCSSQFFPYAQSATKLILTHTSLKDSLQTICNTNDISNLDAAFRIVLSEWKSSNNTYPRTISDIISEAKAISKPDLFLDTIPAAKMMPHWFIVKCESLKDVHYRVECGNFIAEYKGLNACIGSNPQEPPQDQLDAILDSFDFINFLIHTYKIS